MPNTTRRATRELIRARKHLDRYLELTQSGAHPQLAMVYTGPTLELRSPSAAGSAPLPFATPHQAAPSTAPSQQEIERDELAAVVGLVDRRTHQTT